jgi:Flp pilus assembly protein TadG
MVVTPLLLLLMGIIYFGIILSFKQAVTQSAAEGARSLAPISGAAATQAVAQATALGPTNRPLSGWNKSCASAGMTCTFSPGPCAGNASATCATVTVTYDYRSNPLLPSLPLLDKLMPQRVRSTADGITQRLDLVL